MYTYIRTYLTEVTNESNRDSFETGSSEDFLRIERLSIEQIQIGM